jgi:hypothetical protein
MGSNRIGFPQGEGSLKLAYRLTLKSFKTIFTDCPIVFRNNLSFNNFKFRYKYSVYFFFLSIFVRILYLF